MKHEKARLPFLETEPISFAHHYPKHIFHDKHNGKVRIGVIWQGQKDLNPRHAVLEWLWKKLQTALRLNFLAVLSRSKIPNPRSKKF